MPVGDLMNRGTSRVILILTLLAFTTVPSARAVDGEEVSSQDIHSWEALVHFRLPDGSQQTVHLDDFCFVYYERHFKKTASKWGGPRILEVSDIPREVMSIQNENQERLRFWKISSIRFEYRTEESSRRLYLVATLASPGKEPILWPVDFLRNASTAQLPHFRGRQNGATVEVFLPPYLEEASLKEKVLTGIDLQFEGQTKRRSWL
jgi:hypothetical protein